MSICEQAAEQARWDRHCDSALTLAASWRRVAARPVLAIAGADPDDLAAPGPAHPAARAIAGRLRIETGRSR